MAATMAKKKAEKQETAKRSDGGKHVTPRVHVPLPKDLVEVFRQWCDENRRVMGWEIAHLMESFLQEQGRLPKTQERTKR